MRRRGNPWPIHRGKGAMHAVPLVNQPRNTILRFGIVAVRKPVLPPGDPRDPFVLIDIQMVKSTQIPVQFPVLVAANATPEVVAQTLAEALEYMQTFLNCRCTPEGKCDKHKEIEQKSQPDPARIVLTDG